VVSPRRDHASNPQAKRDGNVSWHGSYFVGGGHGKASAAMAEPHVVVRQWPFNDRLSRQPQRRAVGKSAECAVSAAIKNSW
jgi:hypothetical protein